ncbi:MAG: hypothetical protein ABA06_01640 [Parcubacteria bacterium C7867-001]|nr:MAG: hypothetical protein ABA06_01640 [Parcubacteria bacterium C7867-001]
MDTLDSAVGTILALGLLAIGLGLTAPVSWRTIVKSILH